MLFLAGIKSRECPRTPCFEKQIAECTSRNVKRTSGAQVSNSTFIRLSLARSFARSLDRWLGRSIARSLDRLARSFADRALARSIVRAIVRSLNHSL